MKLYPVKQHGFTIVELITVVVLLAVLSSIWMSKFATRSDYTSTTAKDIFLSVARYSQQVAMTRSNLAGPTVVSLQIDQNSGNWRFRVFAGAANIQTFTSDASDVGITATAADSGGGAGPTALGNLTINYNGLGDATGVTGSIANGIDSGLTLNLSGNPAYAVCVSPTGFAYEGACI